jgi:hypothetical protein
MGVQKIWKIQGFVRKAKSMPTKPEANDWQPQTLKKR